MVLDQFLRVEAEAFATFVIASVTFDYSRESVIAFFDYVLAKEFDAQNEDSETNNVWCMRLAQSRRLHRHHQGVYLGKPPPLSSPLQGEEFE
ncbi:MAG: hypothetical protein AB7F76_18670, partial [Parvibaculaceae bacterium]